MLTNYNDYQNINDLILNENLSFNEIKEKIKNLNKKDILNYLIKLFNKTADSISKQNISKMLLLLYLANFSILGNHPHFTEKEIDILKKELSLKDKISEYELKKYMEKDIYDKEVRNKKFKHIDKLKISNKCINLIKEHEKLKLVVYDLHDGKLTVGYGHAEDKHNTKLRVGQRITPEQAENYLLEDIAVASNGIKRLFHQWEDEGIDIKITQSMYDAMVSITFNIGVTAMRNTEFIGHIKNKDFDEAAESIKTTRLKKGFDGLITRRENEYKLFTRDLS